MAKEEQVCVLDDELKSLYSELSMLIMNKRTVDRHITRTKVQINKITKQIKAIACEGGDNK